MDNIEIRIVTEADGSNVSLDNLSIQATNSLIDLLSALRNIALHEDRSDITIGVKSGSACALMNGPHSSLQVVHDNIMRVVNNEPDRDNVYVSNLKIIQKQLQDTELGYEISYSRNNITTPIIDIFQNRFRNRRINTASINNFQLEFFCERLLVNGGKKPNFHLEDGSTISCTEEEARKVNSYLYQDVKISAWGKVNSKNKVEYVFCDIYNANERDFYTEFKTFFTELNTLHGTEPIKKIHYKLREFYSNRQYRESRKFIKLFCNENTDINYLMAILVVSKSFKQHEDLEDLLSKVEQLVSAKTKKPVL